MVNVCYIISDLNKSFSFEWIVSNWNYPEFRLHFILMNESDSEMETFLKKANVNCYRVPYSSKLSLILSVFKIRRFLKKNRIEIVHCHLFEACLAGLTAAKIAGVKRRIHTRHNSTINHEYYPHGVKYDKLINYLSTDIIAISRVVKDVLVKKEGVPENKISIIYHGFDFDDMFKIADNTKESVRLKYKLENTQGPIIGVISRFIHYKGIQHIIPVFKRILPKYPNTHLVIGNASGPYSEKIEDLLRDLPADNFTLVPFEKNIFGLYRLFDVLIHVPIHPESEAFGQVYVEGWALEVPGIFTPSGIIKEFGVDEDNCIFVDFKDEDMLYHKILRVLDEPKLRKKLIEHGKTLALNNFTIKEMCAHLYDLYSN